MTMPAAPSLATRTTAQPALGLLSARITLVVAVLVLLLATGLRFYRLDAQSFWSDEGNSARLSERPLSLIIEGTASDIHPPLYYLLLRGWRELLGDSEFALRSFSAFTGVLTVAVVLALGTLLWPVRGRPGHPRAAVLLSGLLAAVNPALVYYSQETRMYALLAFLAALATIFLWRWLASMRGWLWPAAYVTTLTAGLYTHYFFPVVLLLHALFVFLWWLRQKSLLVFNPQILSNVGQWRRVPLQWAGLVLLSLLLYTPWMPIFLRQAGGRTPTRGSLLAFFVDSLGWLALGETAPRDLRVWVAILVVLLLGLSALRAGRRMAWPFLGTVVPILFMYAVGTTQPAFFKFMLLAVPFFVIAVAGPLETQDAAAGWVGRSPLVAGLLLVVLLGGTAVALNNLYFDPAYARADYRGMAARIAADGQNDAAVILNAPNQWEVFTYYHRDGAPVYPLPKGQPDPALLEPQLADIAADHQRIYALFWGEEQRDPERIVESWLDAHAYKAAEEWVGDVRFVVYAVPAQAADTPDVVMDTPFGTAIRLQGFALPEREVAPGDILPLTLFWQTDRPLDERFKVFVHLVDEAGGIVAQRDGEPGGGQAPTDTWTPHTPIRDNQGLLVPVTAVPGTYELLLGLYDSADPQARLPVEDGRADNALSLGRIRILPPAVDPQDGGTG